MTGVSVDVAEAAVEHLLSSGFGVPPEAEPEPTVVSRETAKADDTPKKRGRPRKKTED